MPIYLPRSPQYRGRVSPRASINPRQADLRPSYSQGQAIVNLGRVITQRADQLKAQRDASVVGDLYNEWRDQDRETLSELLQRKGRFAKDLGQFYDGDFNKSMGEFDGQTENGSQQRMLNDLLSRKRENNLDILARYEVQEGQRYKAEVQQGVIANAEQDVRGFGVNDLAKVDETIAETIEFVRASNPGRDTTAAEQTIKSSLLFANTQSLIDQDPEVALAVLEDRKEDLGEGYLKLKENAEQKLKEKLVEQIRNDLNAKHTDGIEPNFNNMEDEISKNKELPDDIKDSVIVWIRSQEREYEARETKRINEIKDVEYEKVFNSFVAGDYVGAYDAVIKSSEIPAKQKFVIAQAIKKEAKAFGETTDPTKSLAASIAALKGELTRDEAIDLISQGVGINDIKKILNEIKSSEVPASKAENGAIADAKKAVREQLLKGSLFSGYSTLSKKDAYKGVKDLEREIANVPEGVTVLELLEPTSPHYILDKVVERNLSSTEDHQNAMMESLLENEESARKPGESVDDYLRRTDAD